MAKEKSFKLKILGLSVKEDEELWTMKAKSETSLDEVRSGYKTSIVVDEEYFKIKIEGIDKQLAKVIAEPDLFEDWKATKASLMKNKQEVEKERESLKKLELTGLTIYVEKVEFIKGVFFFRITQETVTGLIKIRDRFEAFVMELE